MYKKKHVDKSDETAIFKPLSLLLVKISQGRNFPDVGEGVFGKEKSNVYAKLLLRDPTAGDIEPPSHYSRTEYQKSNPTWLEDFEFQVSRDKRSPRISPLWLG